MKAEQCGNSSTVQMTLGAACKPSIPCAEEPRRRQAELVVDARLASCVESITPPVVRSGPLPSSQWCVPEPATSAPRAHR